MRFLGRESFSRLFRDLPPQGWSNLYVNKPALEVVAELHDGGGRSIVPSTRPSFVRVVYTYAKILPAASDQMSIGRGSGHPWGRVLRRELSGREREYVDASDCSFVRGSAFIVVLHFGCSDWASCRGLMRIVALSRPERDDRFLLEAFLAKQSPQDCSEEFVERSIGVR